MGIYLYICIFDYYTGTVGKIVEKLWGMVNNNVPRVHIDDLAGKSKSYFLIFFCIVFAPPTNQ